MLRLAKWSIYIGILVIFLKIVLAGFQIVFLPMPGRGREMTDLVLWYMDNLGMGHGYAIALDFSNSIATWISGILVGFGLVLIIISRIKN